MTLLLKRDWPKTAVELEEMIRGWGKSRVDGLAALVAMDINAVAALH